MFNMGEVSNRFGSLENERILVGIEVPLNDGYIDEENFQFELKNIPHITLAGSLSIYVFIYSKKPSMQSESLCTLLRELTASRVILDPTVVEQIMSQRLPSKREIAEVYITSREAH